MVRRGPSAVISKEYQPTVNQGGIIGGMFNVLVGSDSGEVPLSAYARDGSQLRCYEFKITDSQKGPTIGVPFLNKLAKIAYLDNMRHGDLPLIRDLVSSRLTIVSAEVDSNGKTGHVIVQAPEVEIDNACLVAIKLNQLNGKDKLAIKEVTNSDSGYMVISISIDASGSSGAGTPTNTPSSGSSENSGGGNPSKNTNSDSADESISATGTEESGEGTTKGAGGSDARAMYDGIVALFDDLLAQLMRMVPSLEIGEIKIPSFKPNLDNPELLKVLKDFEDQARKKIEEATRKNSTLALKGVQNALSAARNVQETIVNDKEKRLEPIQKILAHLHTKHRLPGPLRTALIVGDVPAGFEADVGRLSEEIQKIYSDQETDYDTDYVAGTNIPKNWMARFIDPIKDFIAENGWFLVTPPGNNRSLLNCQAASKESARGMLIGLISNSADACSVSIMAQFLGLPVIEFVVGTFVVKNIGYFSHRIKIPGVSLVVGLASTGMLAINLVLNFFDISLSSGLESLAQKRLYDKMGFNSVITVTRDVGGQTQEIEVTAYEDHLHNIKRLNAGKDSELFVEAPNARYQLHQAIWGVNYDKLVDEKNRLSGQMMDKLGENPTSESVNAAYQFIVESSNAPGMQIFLADKLMAVVSPELAIEFTGLGRDIRVNEDGSYGPKRLSFVLNEGARLMLDSIVQGRFPWFALVQVLPALVTYLIDLKTEREYSKIRDETCIAVTHLDTELLDFLAPYCTQRTMNELRKCMDIIGKGSIPRDLRTQMSEYVSGMIGYALVEAWELAQISNAVPADAA